MASRKLTTEWARYKNHKRLKRKGRKYIPKINIGVKRVVVHAPESFSIIELREEVIEYIDKILKYSNKNKFVLMDMSKIYKTDALTVALIIAVMMDRRESNIKSFVRHVSVKIPTGNSQPAEIFRKCHFDDTVTTHIADQNYFMSRTDKAINIKYTNEIINFAADRGVSDARTILNPILVEIFSNTNNHASIDEGKIPWYLSIMDNGESLCFSVIDLGMGIFESLRTNQAIKNLPKHEYDVVSDMYDNEQSKYLSLQIPNGVYSSTKETYRGKGLREIYEKAISSTTCRKFVIISNKAMVNLLDINNIQHDSNSSFSGTSFYWEMKK